ncbi:MAG: FlgD immunoglobulin-like domain containing protein [bacterium]
MKFIYMFLALLVFNAGANSQWSIDPSENLKVASGGISPQICTDGNGGAYIAWETGAPPNRRLLRIQRLDRYGFKQFPEKSLPIRTGEFDQANLMLFEDGVGGAIVVFNELLPVADTLKAIAYAQHIDSAGTRVWGDSAVVISESPAHQIPLAACGDGSGGAFVFWSEDRNQNGAEELYGNRIDATGNRFLTDDGVLIVESTVDIEADAVNSNGPIVSFNKDNKILIQKFTKELAPVWADEVDAGLPFRSAFRKMFSDGSGGVVLSNKEQTFFDNEPFFKLWAQRLDGNGIPMWNEGIALVDSVSEPSRVPEIEKTYENIFFAWSDNRNGSRLIYAQLVTLEGDVNWQRSGIPVSLIPSIKGTPQVVADKSNGIIVVFGDTREPMPGIYGQRVSASGDRLWSTDDVLISGRPDAGRGRQMTPDGSGGAIVTWYEIGTGTGNGIFAQQISREGKLGDVVVSVRENEETDIPSSFRLFQSYPNPFNPSMTIKYHIPEFSYVTLKIFDLTGKEVITLVHKKQGRGVHQISWNGKDEKGGDVASGVYIYRLQAGNSSTRAAHTFVQSRKAVFLK